MTLFDYQLLDALLVCALQRQPSEVTASVASVSTFLFQHGLVLDGAHALNIFEKLQTWQADSGGGGGGGGEREGERQRSSDASESVEIDRNDSLDSRCDSVMTNRERHVAEKYSDPLAAARESVQKLFPGVLQNQRGRMVSVGDKLQLKAASFWVCKQGKFKKVINGVRGRLSKLNLCVHEEASQKDARVFDVEAVTLRCNQMTPASEKSVHFGDTVRLRAGRLVLHVKLVCPGRSGPVHAFDTVTVNVVTRDMRTVQSTWCLSAYKRFGGVLPVFTRGLDAEEPLELSPLCVAIHFADPAKRTSEKIEVQEDQKPLDISVLVYNTWLMPRLGGFLKVLQTLGVDLSFKKTPRSKMIPGAILSSLQDLDLLESADDIPDVIVLCEAFCDVAITRLRAGLKRKMGLLYETPVCGSGPIIETHAISNGGVIVLSRFPIVTSRCQIYKHDWARDDGLANKGAIYVRILKNGKPFNLVATHLQAWEYSAAIRAREGQMLCMRKLAQELDVGASEPLVYAGDLNVCRVRSEDQYERMLDILAADDPHHVDPEVLQIAKQVIDLQDKKDDAPMDVLRSLESDERLHKVFSFNSSNNTLAMGGPSSGDGSALLDYALFSRDHLQPSFAMTTVLSNIKGEQTYKWKKREHVDLSDHYPILAKFSFGK